MKTLILFSFLFGASVLAQPQTKCVTDESGKTCATYEQKGDRYVISSLVRDGEKAAWLFQKNVPNKICNQFKLGKQAFLVFGAEDKKVDGTESTLFWYEASTEEAKKLGLHRPIEQLQCADRI